MPFAPPILRKNPFYRPKKVAENVAGNITNLQQIASIVNGLQKPTFSNVIEYDNCRKKIEIINQLITKKGAPLAHIDLNSFCLSFETILNQWCNESPECRTSAREKIWNFYTSIEETILDLSHLNLTSLPDIFQFEPFQNRLIELKLSYNSFRHLPDSLATLRKLKQLSLLHCHELEELPDCLGDLEELTELSISCNNLIRLPPSLCNLKALRVLLLSGNFTSLPDLSNLRTLRSLTFNCKNLRRLPDLSNLQALESLDIYQCNNLRRLPDLSNLQALTYLKIDSYSLIRLPASLGKLRALRQLYIECNNLRSLPPSLCSLQALQRLMIFCNNLRSLPPSLCSLQALIELYISCNNLTGLPSEIQDLPSTCTINLTECNLSQAVLENLRRITVDPAYVGPRIIFSVSDRGNREEEKSIEESLEDLYAKAHQIPIKCTDPKEMPELWLNRLSDIEDCQKQGGLREVFANKEYLELAKKNFWFCNAFYDVIQDTLNTHKDKMLPSVLNLGILHKLDALNTLEDKTLRSSLNLDILHKLAILRSWLNRLSYIGDYQKEGELQKAFVNKIIEYLELANADFAFRDNFYCVIQDASETCGDRMALSVLHLGIAHKLATINLKDIEALADFLIKGPWTIKMLGEIARNKIPYLPFFDQIEIYLGYPMQLMQELNIPIDIKGMLFFTISGLQEKDLQEARDFVLSQQKDPKARIEFLITNEKWKEALSANYKEEYAAIEDKRNQAVNLDNPDYEAIEKQFNNDLRKLTKNVLDGFVLGDYPVKQNGKN